MGRRTNPLRGRAPAIEVEIKNRSSLALSVVQLEQSMAGFFNKEPDHTPSYSRYTDQPAAPAADRRHEHAALLTRDAAQLSPRHRTPGNIPRALTRHRYRGRPAPVLDRAPGRRCARADDEQHRVGATLLSSPKRSTARIWRAGSSGCRIRATCPWCSVATRSPGCSTPPPASKPKLLVGPFRQDRRERAGRRSASPDDTKRRSGISHRRPRHSLHLIKSVHR